METPSYRKTKKPLLPKTLMGCGLPILGLLVFLLFWWWRINTVPASDIPTPRLPVPNAHDTYVAAGNALQDEKKIEFAIQVDHTSTSGFDHSYTLAQKQALLDKNKAVLAQIQMGLQQEYYAPPVRSDKFLLPYYAKFRGLARLLRLKEQLQEAKGDWNGSVNSSLDAVQLGTQTPRGSVMLGELVAVAIQAIGRREVWPAVKHLDVIQSRKAIARLQSIRALTVPLSATIQEEEWYEQANLQEIFQQPNWAKNFVNSSDGSEEDSSFSRWYQEARIMLYGKRGITMNYTRYMDQIRDVMKKPYGTHLKYPEVPDDPITQLYAPNFEPLSRRYAENQTQNEMLLLALCLHTYRLKQGRYPQTLAELTPIYLPHLPEDPFAVRGTYGYKLKGGSYVLYSVGPDSKDDGGVPIDDRSKISKQSPHSQSRYFVQEESTGDIVAGINP